MALAVVTPTENAGEVARAVRAPPQEATFDHQVAVHGDALLMVATFFGGSMRYFQALATMSSFVRYEGEKAVEVLDIITDQRLKVMRVLRTTASFIGMMYGLEQNTLQELEVFFTTVNTSARSPGMVRRCTEVTVDSLKALQESATECLALLEGMKEATSECREEQGVRRMVDEAFVHSLRKLSGSQAESDLIAQQEKAMKLVNEKRAQVLAVRDAVVELDGLIPELGAKYAVMESVANGEQRKKAEMDESAKKLEADAKQKLREAGHAMNERIKRTILGVSVYSYEDNKGDAERIRAEKLREFAKWASQDAATQQDKMIAAKESAAKLQCDMEKAAQAKLQKLKQLTEADAEYQAALDSLKALQARGELESKSFGGVSLQALVKAKACIESFCDDLVPQMLDEAKMYRMFRAQVQKHALAITSLTKMLTVTSDAEVLEAFKAVRPRLQSIAAHTSYYQGKLQDIRVMVEKDMRRIGYSVEYAGAHVLLDQPSLPCPSSPSSGTAGTPQQKPAVAQQAAPADEDDDDLW